MSTGEDFATVTIDSDTLVARLQDPSNQEAWYRVDERYGPLVVAFARRLGLAHEEAADARQEAMIAFAEAVRKGKFDRSRGRLRDFLFGISANKIGDVRSGQSRRAAQLSVRPDETDFFDRIPDQDRWAKEWELEWELAVRAQCLYEAKQKFSSNTYAAFHLRAIEDWPSARVAEYLATSVNAVDIATHKVRAFLRQIRSAVEELF